MQVVLILGALCALIVAGISESMHTRTEGALTRTGAAYAGLLSARTLQNDLLLAESEFVSYLLTARESHLAAYQTAVVDAREQSALLSALPSPRIQNTPALQRLRDTLDTEIRAMNLVLELHEQGQLDRAQAIAALDRRDALDALKDHAQEIAEVATDKVQRMQDEMSRILIVSRVSVVLAILAALGAFALYMRQEHLRRQHHNQLAAAHGQLEAEVQARTHELTRLATYLQDAEEKERRHLARELHDELGALMTAAKLDVARLRSKLPDGSAELRNRLAHLNTILDEAVALKRRVIDRLHPATLADLGLIAALDALTRDFRTAAAVTMEVSLDDVEVSDETALTIYRMVQEALTNIGRYANASEVSVSMRDTGEGIEVVVRDNGRGFDVRALSEHSHGLAGMRHRLLTVGGTLKIQTAPGNGTVVRAHLPAPAQQPDPARGHSEHAEG